MSDDSNNDEQYRDPFWLKKKRVLYPSAFAPLQATTTAATTTTTTTTNLLLFVLLLIFLTMLILIVILCKIGQLQKTMDLFTTAALIQHQQQY